MRVLDEVAVRRWVMAGTELFGEQKSVAWPVSDRYACRMSCQLVVLISQSKGPLSLPIFAKAISCIA